jgi:hypothetical protein
MLTENDVISAVCNKLIDLDFEIRQKLHTSEKGVELPQHCIIGGALFYLVYKRTVAFLEKEGDI